MFWLCCHEILSEFKIISTDFLLTECNFVSSSFKGSTSHARKLMCAKLPDREQQAQYCNQENQQTAGPVHFFHNPKR